MDSLELRFQEMREQWPTREDHPRWEIEDGLAFFRKVVHEASQAGWRLALCGNTVVKGNGQDLDIIAVRWKDEASYLKLVNIFERAGAKPVDVNDLHEQVKQCGFVTEDGHLVDVAMLGTVLRSRFAP